MTTFTKYHGVGGALGVAAGPDSVAFFLENQAEK